MFDRYIGKECEAIVVFGQYVMEGGSGPLSVTGVLESCDDNYLILNTSKSKTRMLVKGKAIIPIKALLVLNVVE